MDLFSLFKFLQCHPFDDVKVFNAQVTQKWKDRSDPESIAKLKILVNCLSLRRPKTTIALLPRSDETVTLNFSRQEQEEYQQAKTQTLSSLNNIEDDGSKHACTSFVNALKFVNELRLICNHGIRKSQGTPIANSHILSWSERDAQERFDQLENVGLARCSNMNCRQDLISALSSEIGGEHEDDPWINETLELWCAQCHKVRVGMHAKSYKICNHLPRRSQKLCISQDSVKKACAAPTSSQGISKDIDPERLPTKVKRLVQDLLDTPADVKRYAFHGAVVFRISSPICVVSSSHHGPKHLISFSPSSGLNPSVVSVSMAPSLPPVEQMS